MTLPLTDIFPALDDVGGATFPSEVTQYPRLRYMGNKHKLLPWIWQSLSQIRFDTALDLFAGTGCVAYLMKSMGKSVIANDFLGFAHQLAIATIENDDATLSRAQVETLQEKTRKRDFIEKTFDGIFFTTDDLRFLDQVWANITRIRGRHRRALVLASLVRACLKRQPRGVFTVAGTKYDDGRRDLRLCLREHFLESVDVFNALVFANGRPSRAIRGDAFAAPVDGIDLVYMDPPYVPRADDNCYIKRYHFLEGLVSYWTDEGTEIMEASRVKKIPKRYTPFSYRASALDAFDRLFDRFAASKIVLSYSSNGYPDLQTLVRTLKKTKKQVEVVSRAHRYHFGTHRNVADVRKSVDEYLIIGE